MTTVRYQMTKSELLAAAMRRRMFQREFIVLEVGLLACALITWLWAEDHRYLVFYFAGSFLCLPLLTLIVLWRTIRAIPMLTAETMLSFDTDGIVVSTAGLKSEVAWSSYVKLTESADHFFLYLSQGAGTTIPKRAFTPEEADLFRTYAQAIKIPQKA